MGLSGNRSGIIAAAVAGIVAAAAAVTAQASARIY